MNLYTEDGWLNFEEIRKQGCWLNVIIGARQVGKTYAALKMIFDHPETYAFLMRRSNEELEAIATDPSLNPFLPLKDSNITADIVKRSKKTWNWGLAEYDEDGKPTITESRGIGMSLSALANLRGFAGSKFTDLIFDEFIPEKIVLKRKNEGETFLNAYTTINGNRELAIKGHQPPLKCWLMANAFDLFSDILTVYGLTSDIAEMVKNGEEWKILDGGVFLCVPHSEKIIQERAETAQMRFLRKQKTASQFLDMALNNSFAYNDTSAIRQKSLKGYRPLLRVGKIYAWECGTSIYFCKSAHKSRECYTDLEDDLKRFRRNNMELGTLYVDGYVTFSDAGTLQLFKKYLDIK